MCDRKVCVVCVKCDQWNDGEGNKKCLKCFRMRSVLPSETSGDRHDVTFPAESKKMKYIMDSHGMLTWISEVGVDLRKLFGLLDDISRTAVMEYMNGKNWKELGEIMGMNKGNAKKKFLKILRRLREAYDAE